jgi:hypothetical protein
LAGTADPDFIVARRGRSGLILTSGCDTASGFGGGGYRWLVYHRDTEGAEGSVVRAGSVLEDPPRRHEEHEGHDENDNENKKAVAMVSSAVLRVLRAFVVD